MRLRIKEIPVASVVLGTVLVVFSLTFFFTKGFGYLDLHPKESLDDYQWGELKCIATAIAEADSDSEGLEIAKRYNLCRQDGTIDPDNTKTFRLANGKGKRTVRIIGFRHDMKKSGNGVAGITFCFCDSIENAPINIGNSGIATNDGGWEKSSGRELVSGYIHEPALKVDEFPIELARMLVWVKKQSTNRSFESDGVTTNATDDKIFLLSYSEVFGSSILGNDSEASTFTSNDEGEQYQLFAEASDAETIRLYFSSDSYPIWLRSASFADSTDFVVLKSDGTAGHVTSNVPCGIVVAFCL